MQTRVKKRVFQFFQKSQFWEKCSQEKIGSVGCTFFFEVAYMVPLRSWIFEWLHTPLFGRYLEVKLKISEIIYQRWLNGFQTELTNFNYHPDISILTSCLVHASRVTTDHPSAAQNSISWPAQNSISEQHKTVFLDQHKTVFLGQRTQYFSGQRRNLPTPGQQYFLSKVSIISNTSKTVILRIQTISLWHNMCKNVNRDG